MFISFDEARDNFALKLNEGSVYKIAGSIDLHNIINTEKETTADHDGKAVVFEAKE